MKWWTGPGLLVGSALTACIGGGGGKPADAGKRSEPTIQVDGDPSQWLHGPEGEEGTPEAMTPNEMHAALEPCAHRIGDTGAVRLEVKIDDAGKPLDARVIKLGGTVAKNLMLCAQDSMMKTTYGARGGPATLVIDVGM